MGGSEGDVGVGVVFLLLFFPEKWWVVKLHTNANLEMSFISL